MSDSIIAAILRWLRAGYPEGVPPQDYIPLLALLRRTFSEEELAKISERLAEVHAPVADLPDADVPGADLPGDADLTATGDPEPAEAANTDEDRRSLVQRVLDWLRIGYPEGVPSADFIPLLALLRRRLSEEEITEVAQALQLEAGDDREISSIDARVVMSRVLNDLPSEEDLARVRERLERVGVTLV
ncbi:DUF3349 domain-containing protein [Leucobacter japonicus]|uniref:DUF3349 domain-containing protein n=1 Tax=Leucobacter japonicus TaxID=1461259 RepID=UPI000AD1615A|nr:DUF3349 domain-containing protein [Leucobacter japonicus]